LKTSTLISGIISFWCFQITHCFITILSKTNSSIDVRLREKKIAEVSTAPFAWLISHQPALLFFQNKPATFNQPTVLFSQNKPASAISYQPNEPVACDLSIL
jgi:hypothetical protein